MLGHRPPINVGRELFRPVRLSCPADGCKKRSGHLSWKGPRKAKPPISVYGRYQIPEITTN